MVNLGVTNIITFDAHDARVQNAIPLGGFESISPAYQMIKALTHNVENVEIDKDKIIVLVMPKS